MRPRGWSPVPTISHPLYNHNNSMIPPLFSPVPTTLIHSYNYQNNINANLF